MANGPESLVDKKLIERVYKWSDGMATIETYRGFQTELCQEVIPRGVYRVPFLYFVCVEELVGEEPRIWVERRSFKPDFRFVRQFSHNLLPSIPTRYLSRVKRLWQR